MANHNAAMDSMLNTSGFWDNMLMPGFDNGGAGAFGGLSGGGGVMLGDGVSLTSPFPARFVLNCSLRSLLSSILGV